MVCRALAIGVLEALVMGNMKPVGLPGEALVRIEEGHMRCAAIQSTATPVPVQAPQPYRLRAWIGHYSPCVAAVLLGALPVGWVAQTSPAVRDAHAFLQRYVSVTAQDIAALDRGGVVVQTLKTNAPTGVAILGVIRIAASSESFLERFRDITDFKKGPEIPQVGRFADPPRLEDVEPLVVDAADLEALRSCRVGNCDIKLTGQMVGRFHQIDWAAPNWRDLTASLFKRLLVERVVAYSRSGNTALGAYRDKGRAVEIADEIHAVVDASARLCGHAPEFLKHVECPSSQVLAASEHFVYWSKEKLAFKPVTSLTDVTIYRKAYEATAATFIASKDLYLKPLFPHVARPDATRRHWLQRSSGVLPRVCESLARRRARRHLQRSETVAGRASGTRRCGEVLPRDQAPNATGSQCTTSAPDVWPVLAAVGRKRLEATMTFAVQ